MRIALRVALEGSMVLALASLTMALYCTIRLIRARRATAVVQSREPEFEASAKVRRPVFLPRRDLL